ncbi:calcium-dependent phosphotriesterase [Hypoxylon sp. FL1284]|nr:calcium-dependent phosphotriesterase [Hypoxylon sp. FL1284]
MLKIALSALAFAVTLPYLQDCFERLSIIRQNAPGRLATVNAFNSRELKYADQIRSCEDGLLIESKGLAILACDPGREKWNTVMGVFVPGPVPGATIYAYDYKDSEAQDSESLKPFKIVGYEPGIDLHTLGLAYHEETSTLFVANHRTDGSAIEMFELDLVKLTATHLRTIKHPLLHGPNSITLISNHELLVTNDHYFLVKEHPILAIIETYLSLPLGTAVYVDISPLPEDTADATNVKAKVVARLPFANGIEVLNDTTVAIATTSKAAVYLHELSASHSTSSSSSSSPEPPTLAYRSKIRFPFMVDNIQASSDGALLVAGHPNPIALTRFAKTRHVCNSPVELAAADPSVREYCVTARAPSWVSRWTEARGIEHLYVGDDYPSSCTATYDPERKVGIVTGLYAKGILVWRE